MRSIMRCSAPFFCLGLIGLALAVGPCLGAGETDPLAGILEKTKEYCRRLEAASLNFICIEDIREREYSPPLKLYASQATAGIRRHKSTSLVYDYQLVRSGPSIVETRILLEENGVKKEEKNAPLKTRVFKFKHMIFGPLGLLSSQFQPAYSYALLDRERIGGEAALVLEAKPTEAAPPENLYGKVWVREKDFAILKIEWEQTSMAEFEKVRAVAAKLKAEPQILLVCFYGVEKNGIRFPSQLLIHENYRDGKGLLTVSETKVNYKTYRFFAVETEVKY